MKILKTIGLTVIAVLFLTSCAPGLKPNGNRGLPPGQVKKVTGSKSAKRHAPGQKKKRTKRRYDFHFNDLRPNR